MSNLAAKHCGTCADQAKPLDPSRLTLMLQELNQEWRIVDAHHLERELSFPDFRQALDFTVRIGELAEQQGHHPDLYLSWGKVAIKLWTHSAGGLTENDFIIAGKIDELK